MKQYFIGIEKRTKKLIIGLLDLGATLMFYYHPKTIELNNMYKFYSGEWMLYTDVFPDSGIQEIKEFLEEEKKKDPSINYKIVYFQDIHS